MKKGLIGVLLIAVSVISINLISAASFSAGKVLDSFDSQTMFLMTLFIIVFAGLFFSASRVFKNKSTGQPERTIAAVVSLAISLFVIYGINKMDMDIQGMFYDIGLSEGLLGIIIPIILIAGLIYLLVKVKSKILLILGALFILISIADLVYEKEALLWLGIILIVLWIIFSLIFRKKKDPASTGGIPPRPTPRGNNDDWKREYERQREEAARQRREAEKHRNQSEEQRKKAEEEAIKRQEAEQKGQREEQRRQEGFDRARKEGIRNLMKERAEAQEKLRQGYERAAQLHAAATRLGWTKAGAKPRQGESPEAHKARAEQASEAYKAWYRQYSQNIQLDKHIKEIDNRIEHLNKQLNR